MTNYHGDTPLGERHAAHNWEYADATARTAATGFGAGDVGKLARQLSDNSLWRLTATTPTWQGIAGAPAAHAATHASGGTDPVALAASQITSGVLAIGRLATGTPNGTKFVRDDGTLATPAGTAPVGYQPYALSLGLYAGATVSAGAATLPANGGTVLVPVAVAAPLLLESVTVRENSTTLTRGWEWRLYKDTGSATLAEIAGANGSETFTATAASNRTAAATTPATLAAGAYWLALRCTDASNNLNLSGISVGAGTAGFGASYAQTKTLATALGSTLDATAATWARIANVVAARANGAVFGQTTAF